MADSIQELGLIEGFRSSAWMPDWYMGDPTRVYYPPVTNWMLGLTATATGDIVQAYRLFMFAILLSLGLSIYVIGYSWGQNIFAALIGAILVMSVPYTLRTLFVEGNFARGLAILPLPYLVWANERLLTQGRVRTSFILLVFLWAFALLAHIQQAVIFAFILVVYVALRIVMNEYIPIRRSFFALLALIFGGLVASFYILPAYSKIELSNVPYLPDKIDSFTVDWSAIIPTQDNIEATTIGIMLIVFCVLYSLRFGKQHQKAIVIVASLSVLLAFGEKGGLYLFLPLRQLILPERFLNITAIMLPLMIASTPNLHIGRRWLIIGAIVVLWVDFYPVWRIVHMRPPTPDLVHLADISASRPYQGRSVPLINPSPSSAQVYLTSLTAGRDSATGWALENTPQHEGIRRLGRAMERSLDYLPALLSLWNTDYIITENNTEIDSLNGIYDVIAADGGFKLWERFEPSSFAQILPKNQMLVIGDNPSVWMFAFPFASEGFSPELADYDPNYLIRFDTIGINRIKSPNQIEALLQPWVEEGGTLIMDLSNLQPPYNAGFEIFDVQTFSYSLSESSPISGTIANLPSEFTIPSDIEQWVGNTYFDLDNVMLSIEYDGQSYPLLGYKNVGEGQVWFVGFNLFYWLDLQNNQELSKHVVDLILNNHDVYQELTLPSLSISNRIYDGHTLTFDYNLENDDYVILSQTYFPRWRAYLDNQPISIDNHQHLIALNLPKGQHHIRLEYEPYSTVSLVGFAISGFGILLSILTWFALRNFHVLTVQDRIHDFFDRHSYGDLPHDSKRELTLCPNCGQLSAIAYPPTQETYPFFVLQCSECSYDSSNESVSEYTSDT